MFDIGTAPEEISDLFESLFIVKTVLFIVRILRNNSSVLLPGSACAINAAPAIAATKRLRRPAL